MKRYHTTLIIAGSDSCGGAGIQADIKTCAAIGVYATTAITAVTAQNTLGVQGIQPISAEMVRKQVEAILEDFTVDSIKIGMLCNAEIASSVADILSHVSRIPIILDPVMVSTSGHCLLSEDAINIIKHRLLPMAKLITPNMQEAAMLSGCEIESCNDIAQSANKIMQYNCHAVLMKGGHLAGSEAVDTLYTCDKQVYHYTSPYVDTRNTHGTGCTLASAIAAFTALHHDLPQAITLAKDYVYQAISSASDIFAGHGHGSLNHAFNPHKMHIKEDF